MGYETDERLKGYLDTNQLQRERMCLAVLALDQRFTNVRPRHPRGGPDGGRDIEATYRRELLAYGAVGFVNQATDTEEKKRDVRDKFVSDLESAKAAEPRPVVFVFMTNVNLTAGEKGVLLQRARADGFIDCDILDRERLRIALDSADGLAARFQYLGLTLTEAEQASFFAKWGDDINALIATGFQEVHRTLDHLLFLQEARDPIDNFLVVLDLDRQYAGDDIGHFRAFCMLTLKEPKLKILSLLFGSSDKSNRFRTDLPGGQQQLAGIKHGIGTGQWVQSNDSERSDQADEEEAIERYSQVGCSSHIGVDNVARVAMSYHADRFIRFKPVLSLKDFDECMFLPMITRTLAHRVSRIRVISNGYKLLDLAADRFYVDDASFDPSLPVSFDSTELADPWVRCQATSGTDPRPTSGGDPWLLINQFELRCSRWPG